MYGPSFEGAAKTTLVGMLEVMQETEDWEKEWEDGDILDECFFDERTGEELDPEKSTAARMEELGFMKKIQLYEYKDVAECWHVTGKAPISTKWVGSCKGDMVRMRLVARDFKPKNDRLRGDLFAATPPLEAKKLLIRMAIGQPAIEYRKRRQKMKLRFIDISKPHLNGV